MYAYSHWLRTEAHAPVEKVAVDHDAARTLLAERSGGR